MIDRLGRSGGPSPGDQAPHTSDLGSKKRLDADQRTRSGGTRHDPDTIEISHAGRLQDSQTEPQAEAAIGDPSNPQREPYLRSLPYDLHVGANMGVVRIAGRLVYFQGKIVVERPAAGASPADEVGEPGAQGDNRWRSLPHGIHVKGHMGNVQIKGQFVPYQAYIVEGEQLAQPSDETRPPNATHPDDRQRG